MNFEGFQGAQYPNIFGYWQGMGAVNEWCVNARRARQWHSSYQSACKNLIFLIIQTLNIVAYE